MKNYRFWGAIAQSAARKAIALSTALVTLVSISPTWAADPFRSTNPRPIGANTEAAFKAIFQDGNYGAAQAVREDIIRPPQLICCENFVGTKSIDLLKRELGLG